MPLPEILDLVTTRLESVPAVRNVYNYRRLVVDAAKFKALFQDPAAQKLHTWMVVRESARAADEGTQAFRRFHHMTMLGYYAISDDNASELAFNEIIEAVCEVFDPIDGRTYNNVVDWSGPTQVEGPVSLQFGSVLCHAVKITVEVQEWPLS